MHFNPSSFLRKKLEAGELCLGIFHLTANSHVSEALSTTLLDWLVYDMEASPASKEGVVHFLQSLKGSGVAGMVRPALSEHSAIEQALDAGAAGMIIPKIDTKEGCQRVVAAAKYPPLGKRGVNPVRASGYFSDVKSYFNSANAETLIFVQAESRQAVENIESILSVDGLDGVFVGCGDLAMDLGCAGEMDSPAMVAAIKTVLQACQKHKKVPGIFAYSLDLAKQFIADGYQLVAFGNDIGLLKQAVGHNLDALKRWLK
jgi:2-keto-3-deoxy-L-rhamnonate aldolase RhmA